MVELLGICESDMEDSFMVSGNQTGRAGNCSNWISMKDFPARHIWLPEGTSCYDHGYDGYVDEEVLKHWMYWILQKGE